MVIKIDNDIFSFIKNVFADYLLNILRLFYLIYSEKEEIKEPKAGSVRLS